MVTETLICLRLNNIRKKGVTYENKLLSCVTTLLDENLESLSIGETQEMDVERIPDSEVSTLEIEANPEQMEIENKGISLKSKDSMQNLVTLLESFLEPLQSSSDKITTS